MSDFKESLYKIIGERLKTKREDLGLKQIQLSNKLGISRSSISNIEVGRHQIPLHMLYEISNKLNFDFKDLLPENEEVVNFANSNIDTYSNYLKSQPLKAEAIKEVNDYIKKLKL